MNYFYGFDIGGTSVKGGLFDQDFKLVEKFSFDTDAKAGNNIFKTVALEVKKLNEKLSIDMQNVKGIGFGIPGPVKNNYVARCANISWEDVYIEEQIKAELEGDYKVVGMNDANAAAMGEFSNFSSDYSDLIFVTLGTGVGGGIIINSKLVEGVHGAAGELGHVTIENRHGFTCGCGNLNCLETVASANGLVRLAKAYVLENSKQVFDGEITAKAIMDKVKEADVDAINIFTEYTSYLASGLAKFAITVNPGIFVLGGGLSNAGDILVTKVKEEFDKLIPLALSDIKKTPIVLAKLGNDAGIYGAAYSVYK